ncbi:hypothetical protein [Bacillus sp. FSL K6-0067]|uniref:hypothetical protein n=1 Tax=Bacillus sp. FSL K6-0067 TaxID=2921412 RepID=UPI0030F826B0
MDIKISRTVLCNPFLYRRRTNVFGYLMGKYYLKSKGIHAKTMPSILLPFLSCAEIDFVYQ